MAKRLEAASAAPIEVPTLEQDWQRPPVVAAYLKLSRTGLHKMAKTAPGFPQPVRLGHRHTLYDLAAIKRYMESRRAGQAPAPTLH